MNKRFIALLIFVITASSAFAQDKKEFLYVGTFSVRGSEGIYVYSFNRIRKTLTLVQKAPALESPTYLSIHPSGKFLYSVNRGKAEENDTGGSVSAYGIDPKTGMLSGLNHRSSFGAAPCHISFDRTGQYAFVSNITEGNLIVLPVFEDGLIGNPTDSKKYTGSSVNAKRQESSHVHSAQVSPDNKFVYVADLGTDKMYIYKFNVSNGKLEDAKMPEVIVAPGSGPRHFTFNAKGSQIYLAEELTSSIGIFSVNKQSGELAVVQDTIPSLSPSFKGQNTSADIHLHPSGKFLYLSNRGANTIVIYSVDAEGKIKWIGEQPSLGNTPRNFFMDTRGEYLFVANQDSDTIVIFRINPKTGKLTPVGKPTKVPSPVCLKMAAFSSKK